MSIYDTRNRYATPIAYYALHLSEFHLTSHAHDQCEIMYLVSGKCTVSVRDQSISLKERQYIFIDQNVPHGLTIEPETPCTILNLEFTCRPEKGCSDLADLTQNSVEFSDFIERKEAWSVLYDSGKVNYAMKDLIDEMEKEDLRDMYLLDLLFRRMLIEVTKKSFDDPPQIGIRHLRKAKAFIHENLFADLDVGMISEHVRLNHSYLQALFAKHMNCGIMTYVNRLRMDHASFLLKNSNMCVTDMAFHLGYNSRQHFSMTFEKRFGMSPKQYQKLNSQNIKADTGVAQRTATTAGRFADVSLSNNGVNDGDKQAI